MNMISPARHALSAMLADIHQAVVGGAADQCSARVAEAIAPHLTAPDLLDPSACQCCSDGYIRHLLHADPEHHYAVVALVWRPGQMSPVHAHRTWCALGVHQGFLTEGFYSHSSGNSVPLQTGAFLRMRGDTSHGPANPDLIHRLSNLSTGKAISIHAYGADFDRFGSDVNQVYDCE